MEWLIFGSVFLILVVPIFVILYFFIFDRDRLTDAKSKTGVYPK